MEAVAAAKNSRDDGLRHAFRTSAFRQLQHQRSARPAPWIARNIFGCALITWTVRTPEQQAKTYRYADQMTFEGFIPE
jgi:glycerophosphoryl diester phosphodiesterase